MAGPTNGEFTFSLKEKLDRFGNKYLVGGIQFINAIVFIRSTGQTGADGCMRYYAIVKPYTGAKTDRNPDEAVWEDDPPEATPARRQR